MRLRFLLTIGSFVIAIAIGIVMFMVKYEVVHQEEELYRLNEEILDAQRDIHILKAEFAHLSDPERIRELVKKYNDMDAVKPYQIIKIGDIPAKGRDSVKRVNYGGAPK